MHLRQVLISNFRSITDFHVDFKDGANLLIGPNAVGKTTVLEAIRLAKAVLAPRTQTELQQVLVALSAISPQLPQNFNYAAIAGDVNHPIKIDCTFQLSAAEVDLVPSIVPQLARNLVAAQHGISLLQTGQLALVQFLSSPQGQAALEVANSHTMQKIGEIATSKTCKLNLTIDPNGGFSGSDLFAQTLFGQLEGRLSPSKSMFSYFPADRAMPTGDAAIQLGAADAQQQLESHNSNAALKYQRLKSTIFSSFVQDKVTRDEQQELFTRIFLQLLKEKKLEGLKINQFGQASILITDIQTNKTFDIDSLSSGEKGLILTFLLIWKSMEHGGTMLIDEPELHLNSAVCKDLLGFLIDNFLKPFDIQAIICTHSPEMIASAMRSDDATVFHLKKGSNVATIRKQDQPELVQALRLLGTSEIEELLYDGIVFVEGEDDVELLELAFPETRSRFKFKYLQGRGEVEKLIKELQKAEKAGNKDTISYFLFDRDGKQTSLTSTPKVQIQQWDRYCLENYLIDPDILCDVVTREYKTDQWPTSRGDAMKLFSRVANKQLRALVIEEVYKSLKYQNAECRAPDKNSNSFEDAAAVLFDRLEK
jgi:AAA15 family ATPase/GTPase